MLDRFTLLALILCCVNWILQICGVDEETIEDILLVVCTLVVLVNWCLRWYHY